MTVELRAPLVYTSLSTKNQRGDRKVFRLIYFWLEDPASWMAYLQFLLMAVLMGLTYLHVTRRGMSFMVMFGVMTLIFFVDLAAYLPFLAYLRLVRDRRHPALCE
jgi:hypothetical protein